MNLLGVKAMLPLTVLDGSGAAAPSPPTTQASPSEASMTSSPINSWSASCCLSQLLLSGSPEHSPTPTNLFPKFH
ncbi:hypothetical protein CROQUDRAFT_101697 [Cronartium quercuum f. sp. fusiforme G11]|uniref:Uncharacterized protein n=1 Tax=Cronartium quercuum f. sp. fusiforme G11 TaxID=708437 RepID=A0A9P6N567_9BASI|nr:hypothetical protein CROQUDRAFT_101697 [Cronartium quercuum f. sp. fusiforme G11]